MQKLALYRRYRPENFDQVVGQEHIKAVLKNAILEEKISHAYLFAGPRGTGKTSIARVLAKSINCTDRKDHNPCGKCSLCIGVSENRVMDLIEIDAASNRGIDEMRDLREKIKFSPTEGSFKVFIIDEVHMLTKEAFNALLKTLEEPPGHAIFILATTEINKVPATILSRCQRHDFRRIKLSDIVTKLLEIKSLEKINVSDEALEMIAEASEGGLRDAESLLDQLSSIGLEKIEVRDVEAVLGLAPYKLVKSFIENLLKGNKKEAVSEIEKAAKEGVDLTILSKNAVEFLRKLLTVSIGSIESAEGTKEQIETLKDLAQNASQSKIIMILDSFVWAQGAFKTSIDPKVILTILAAKDYDEKPQVASANRQELQKAGERPKPVAQTVSKATDKKMQKPAGKWQHFLMEIKARNNTIHAFMRVASPQFNENEVVLLFPYKFHKERIEETKNKKTVEELLRKVFGEEITIRCELEGNQRNHRVDDVGMAASILGGEVVD